ncbi:MAG: hypothetical protein GEU71_12640 [Actinobacteria bacterium]|nr:hypothetical protein [Actinomycetota bacterium]
MPAPRTEVTEIVTGLAMLGFPSLRDALDARPPELRNVEPAHWDRLDEVFAEGSMDAEFRGAWSNGLAFLGAAAGLRGRRPYLIEWKGPHRTPGYDTVPADLRIDHVYLVSCKYLSKILMNVSPAYLFDRLLVDRRGPVPDWYLEVAPDAYRAFYRTVRDHLGAGLPAEVDDLVKDQRIVLKERLAGPWPGKLAGPYLEFCAAAADASAARWRAGLADPAAQEEMLWRLLRLSGAPYFVLGTAPDDVLRLRIYTPWDWRQEFSLGSFEVTGDAAAGQPVVKWRALVTPRGDGRELPVEGHVEIRWSHGRFRRMPEAKVYLDTPHYDVPGYSPLDADDRLSRGLQLDLSL